MKKSKSSKTTIIVGRGWGYGGHHHDHDNDNDGGDEGGGGGDAGGGDGGGGMGEMFDVLGDLLLKEKYADMSKYKTDSAKEIERQMALSRTPISKQKQADKKRRNSDLIKDTRTDAERMTDATGPRPGSRFRGD